MADRTAKHIWKLLVETWSQFNRDKCLNLAAALSYYTIFSLAPVLIVVMVVLGVLFGQDAVQGEIYAQIRGLVGSEGALSIQAMIEKAYQPQNGFWFGLIGMGMLCVGATGLFINIQDSLNQIWKVQSRPERALLKMLRDRLLSFGMVIGVGFLLLVSLTLNAALVAIGKHVVSFFRVPVEFLLFCEILFSIGATSVLFAAIFKFLPDVKITWKNVTIGAIATAFLFSAGKILIGFYLGHSQVASAYGAAGTVVIVMMWVYYSSIILYWGAEFTHVYTRLYGSPIEPVEYAVKIKKIEKEENPSSK